MAEGSLRELLRRGEPHAQGEQSGSDDDAEYQAFSCGRVGHRALQMVCFIKADGHHTVLPYIDLHAITTPEPGKGFILDFGTREIVVEGEHLEDCFRYVRTHRLAELVEFQRPSAMQTAAGLPVVHTLTIRKPKKPV